MEGQSSKRGASLQVDDSGLLAQWAEWRGRGVDRSVAALADDTGIPVPFIANEVMVDPSDHELIGDLTRLGGVLIEPNPLLPPPIEILRGNGVNDANFPITARVRFERPLPSDVRGEFLSEALTWADTLNGNVRVSAKGADIAALVARLTGQGRRLGLNFLAEPDALPLKNATETFDPTGPGETNSPFTWPAFNGLSRIVHAWQVTESVRAIRSIEPVVWVAILDDGFWVDNAGVPHVEPNQTESDFGAGVLQINLYNEGKPAGGPSKGRSPWHGNAMASAATARVDNSQAVAGSGGTVARPVFFKSDRSDDQVYRCLRYCAAWGLDVLNMSWGRIIPRGLFGIWEMPDRWEETFQFARDNGVVLVASAGNEGVRLPDTIRLPATRTPGVITVGALANPVGQDVQPADARPNDDSNYGESVDIWAPGDQIPVAPDAATVANPVGGRLSSGTSPAAALVSGVAAMMRAVNPSLNSDDIGHLLQSTGWQGTQKVTRILNAEAAVMAALGGSLPADYGEPNNRPDAAAELLPIGPNGSLQPIFGRATRSRSDSDFWKFTLKQVSEVTIRLEWYSLLGHLAMVVEAQDPTNETVQNLVDGGVAGNRTLSGILGTGTYIIRVQGGAQTAYELDVAHRAPLFGPDEFEPNENFEQAKVIVFELPRPPFISFGRTWGPGDFNATLHRRFNLVLRRSEISPDYYKLRVPEAKGMAGPTLSISGAHHPVDVTLFDSSQEVIQEWHQVRSMTVRPPTSSTCFLRVTGDQATGYMISARMLVDPGRLPHFIPDAITFPKWWEDLEIDVDEGINWFALDLTGGIRPDADITLEKSHGNVHVSLANEHGETVREGIELEDGITMDTSGLREGLYFVKIDVRGTGATARRPTLRLAVPKRI